MEKMIISSDKIEGNIGSCEIKSVSFQHNSWNKTTIATDSCTGAIISQNTYFDWGPIYFPVILILITLMFAEFIRRAFN